MHDPEISPPFWNKTEDPEGKIKLACAPEKSKIADAPLMSIDDAFNVTSQGLLPGSKSNVPLTITSPIF